MKMSIKGLKHIILTLSGLVLLFVGLPGCERDVIPPDGQPFVRLLKEQTYQSDILHRPMKYAVLLPEGYENSTDSFPVVYLLHGMGDHETAWYMDGNIASYADLYADEIVPVIFVMPEAFNTYYVNKYNGNYPFMDVFINELVPAIDSTFRTKKDARYRAVLGYSMGGYGALILPAKNPDIFKTGVALSMSFRTDSQYVAEPQNVFDYQWGPIFGGIGAEGAQRLTDYFLDYSPFHFFGDPDGQSLTGLNFYIDCGDDEESLSGTNGELHNMLRDLNFPHEYRMKDGGHSWNYWHKELPEAFSYISHAFQQTPYPSDPDPVDPGPAIASDRIVTEQLEGSGIGFRVVLPADYSISSLNYPLIIVIHDRSIENQDEESQRLFSLLARNITDGKLPESLIIEIPVQAEAITTEYINYIILQVREKYRTIEDSDHAIMIGNSQGGYLVYYLMWACGFSNTFLLFNADLPDNALAFIPEASFYLDICERGSCYKGYHSLYMSLRQNGLNPEYRVRQGTPSHDSFLAGLDEASGFMKDHLK